MDGIPTLTNHGEREFIGGDRVHGVQIDLHEWHQLRTAHGARRRVLCPVDAVG